MSGLFDSLKEWRKQNGRNPENGFRRPARKSKSLNSMADECDDEQLVIIALRSASRTSRHNDLRVRYERIADELETIFRERVDG